MVLPGGSRIPLAGRHWGRRFFSPVHWEKRARRLAPQTKCLQPSLTSPHSQVCLSLCRCLHVRAEQSPFLLPRTVSPLPAPGEGGRGAGIRRCCSKGMLLALHFRCVSQVKFEQQSPHPTAAFSSVHQHLCEGFPGLPALRGLRYGVLIVYN